MTKKEMVAAIASSTELTLNDVAKVLKSLTEVCLSELKANKAFVLNDMVRLRLVDKPALPERQMKSPATGQSA
jgi:nucleoid DNA-binding protein